MLAKASSDPTPEGAQPLDPFDQDPAGIEPLCGGEEFAAEMRMMVAEDAPRVFAIVQEYGDRVDARLAAWGLAFEDHADAITVGNGMHLSAHSPNALVRRFRTGKHVTPHVVWVEGQVP
jgi:hypothetical protein